MCFAPKKGLPKRVDAITDLVAFRLEVEAARDRFTAMS